MVDYENKSAQPIYGCEIYEIYIYIYIYIYDSVLVNEMPKSARYHIDRANSIVFTSKRLPQQPVSSERNHQERNHETGCCGNLFEVKTIIYIYIYIYIFFFFFLLGGGGGGGAGIEIHGQKSRTCIYSLFFSHTYLVTHITSKKGSKLQLSTRFPRKKFFHPGYRL